MHIQQLLSSFLHYLNHAYGLVLGWDALSIYASTFVFEDGAAVLASVFVLNHKMSLVTALATLYFGVISSDIGLYVLGLAARRFRFAARFLDQGKLDAAREWIGQRLALAIVLSRVLPWMLPPTFIACGYFRLPFRRFLVLIVVTAAAWTAVTFGLVLGFGAAALDRDAGWVGAAFAIGCAALLIWKLRGLAPGWLPRAARLPAGAVRTQGSSVYVAPRARADIAADGAAKSAAESTASGVAFAQRLPQWLFYAPVLLLWIVLAVRYRSLTLPTAANPGFEAGGLIGESKLQALEQVAPAALKWVAPFASIRKSAAAGRAESRSASVAAATPWSESSSAMRALAAAGIHFPIVAKPDRGHHGYGVRPIRNRDELARYLDEFPAGETICLQQMIEYPHEAGVFYVRIPGERSGRIFSLSLSEPAAVVGDGASTLAELIRVDKAVPDAVLADLADGAVGAGESARIPAPGEIVPLAFARSLRLGARLTDARHLATPALLARFDEIADNIPEFYFGRFEVRFRSIELLRKGEDFQILEINGAGAEANHIWDRHTRLVDSYRTLFEQFRLVFRIGALNRARGFAPMPLRELFALFRDQQRLLSKFPDGARGIAPADERIAERRAA